MILAKTLKNITIAIIVVESMIFFFLSQIFLTVSLLPLQYALSNTIGKILSSSVIIIDFIFYTYRVRKRFKSVPLISIRTKASRKICLFSLNKFVYFDSIEKAPRKFYLAERKAPKGD